MAHFEAETLPKPTHFNFARDVVDYWAAKTPELQAMHWVSQDLSQQRRLTYAHFENESHRIATLLERLNIKSGQTIIIILPRIPEWWEIAVAALRVGVVICPATTLLVAKDIEFRCQQTGATAFIGDATSVRKFQTVSSQCPQIETIIQIDGNISSPAVINFREAMQKIPDMVRIVTKDTKATDPSIVYFTSGTSGPPKMVQHNQISYPLAHTITGKHWLQLSPGKMYWNLSEQGWAKAAWSFFGTFNCGACLFIHNDQRPFNAKRLIDVLHKFPITTLCAPPTAYRQLVLDENRNYLASNLPKKLSHCTGAGEPLNDSVIKIWQQMTGKGIHDGYGQTETIMVCGNFAGSPIRPGSMGKPSPGVPLTTINPQGEECKPGEEGDIAILAEEDGGQEFFGLFDGYLSSDGLLDRRIRTFDSGSWYLTGDRAVRDQDGYFWFVGRTDDVINSAGYRIGPFEVESTLKLHPAVVESAVVASPDLSRSEVVKAFVVLTTEYAAKAELDLERFTRELQDFCKENAAPYKYPRKLQFVDSTFLPKTISGKIKRSELKQMEWSMAGKSKL